MNRKEVVIGASGVGLAIIALVTIVFIWTTVDNLGKRADDLEQRLTTIENKTWHTVGDFALSPSKTSEEFHIQGEEWRLNFTFNQAVAGIRIGYNLRVYDAFGNIVGGLGGFELSDIENENCILNIQEGQGDFTVEIRGMTAEFTFSFTVEEFY